MDGKWVRFLSEYTIAFDINTNSISLGDGETCVINKVAERRTLSEKTWNIALDCKEEQKKYELSIRLLDGVLLEVVIVGEPATAYLLKENFPLPDELPTGAWLQATASKTYLYDFDANRLVEYAQAGEGKPLKELSVRKLTPLAASGNIRFFRAGDRDLPELSCAAIKITDELMLLTGVDATDSGPRPTYVYGVVLARKKK